MAFNDILRLAHRCTCAGSSIINVFHFKELQLLAGGDNALTLAQDFRDNIGPAWRGVCGADMQFNDVTVQRIVPFGDSPVVAAYPGNSFGTNGFIGNNSPPPSTCATVTWFTGQTGRRKRGRSYLTIGSNGDIARGQLNSGGQTNLNTLANALFTRYVTNAVGGSVNWQLGVWSRVIGGATPPYSTDGFAPVTSVRANSIVRSQRRREIGVGQ